MCNPVLAGDAADDGDRVRTVLRSPWSAVRSVFQERAVDVADGWVEQRIRPCWFCRAEVTLVARGRWRRLVAGEVRVGDFYRHCLCRRCLPATLRCDRSATSPRTSPDRASPGGCRHQQRPRSVDVPQRCPRPKARGLRSTACSGDTSLIGAVSPGSDLHRRPYRPGGECQ